MAFLDIHLIIRLACRVLWPIAFLSCLDCSTNISQLLATSLWISVSVVLMDPVSKAEYLVVEFWICATQLACTEESGLWRPFNFAGLPTKVLALRLSIWITRPSCNPIIEAIHQTLWARKVYWLSLAYDITFSRAYTIMSLSFLKVIAIRWIILTGAGLPLQNANRFYI